MSDSDKSKEANGKGFGVPWGKNPPGEADLYLGAFNALVSLGVPMNLHGFDYLTSAVMLVAEDPSYMHSVTTRLYPTIAETYGTRAHCIERDIRTAIENTFLNKDIRVLYDYFGSMINETSGKVKNSIFISKVAATVRLDAMRNGINDARNKVLKELGMDSKAENESEKEEK